MFQRFNRFSALSDEDDIYGDFEDIIPYNKVIDGKWTSLEYDSHPIAKHIRYRFGDRYYGKLTIYELLSLKERMTNAEKELEAYRTDVREERRRLERSISQQSLLCRSSPQCQEKLEEHLKVCDSTYKCSKDFVAYECQFKKNGRCSHYYEIEHIEEDLGDVDYFLDDYKQKYQKLKNEYERQLAMKENRIDEYDQQMDYEWDEYNFNVGQMMM